MTLNEMTTAMNKAYEGKFGSDYSGYFNISNDEAERIAEKSDSVADFVCIWQDSDWWKDEAPA